MSHFIYKAKFYFCRKAHDKGDPCGFFVVIVVVFVCLFLPEQNTPSGNSKFSRMGGKGDMDIAK